MKALKTYTEVVRLTEILDDIKNGEILFMSNYKEEYLNPYVQINQLFLNEILKGYPLGELTFALSDLPSFFTSDIAEQQLKQAGTGLVKSIEGHNFDYQKQDELFEVLCLDGKSRLFLLYAGFVLDAKNRHGEKLYYNTLTNQFVYLNPDEVDGMLYGFENIAAIDLMEIPYNSIKFQEFQEYFLPLSEKGVEDPTYKTRIFNWINTGRLLRKMEVVTTYVSGFTTLQEVVDVKNYLNRRV